MKIRKLKSAGKALLASTFAATLLLSGCGNSDNFVFTNTNINTVTAPVAVNDAFNALGNATVNQAASGVLANDTLNGATITAFEAVGSNGGTIVLNADGSFSYTPVFGFVGAETFTYTLSNSAGASTATVTMTSTAQGFFVDNTAAPGGDGSQASPFDTLTAGINAANAGDTVFVNRGDGTSNGLAGPVTLTAGVNLIGEGTGLVLAQTIVAPGQAPLLTGPITCLGSNTVSGFTIDGSASDGVIVNGVGDVTITNNTIGNPTARNINLTDITGTVTVSNNTLQEPANIDDDFIRCQNLNTNGALVVSGNTFTNLIGSNTDDCLEVDLFGSSVMNVTVSNNTALGTAPNQFDFGLGVLAEGTSQATVSMTGNNLSNFDNLPYTILTRDTATMNATFTGNTASDVTFDALNCALTGQALIDGNSFSDVTGHAMTTDNGFGTNSSGTFVISNNTITNTGVNAVNLTDFAADTKAAIRNNTLTGSGMFSVNVVANTVFDLCLDITGNTVDDNMNIDTTAAGSNIDLENGAAGLETVNNFTSGMPVINNTGTGAVTNQAAGFCAIP